MSNDSDGVEIVRCAICTKVNSAPQILVTRGNNLAKYKGWKKAKSDLSDDTKKREWRRNCSDKHYLLEWIYVITSVDSIFKLVTEDSMNTNSDQKKHIQFVVLFDLLSNNRPILEFESM